MSNKIKGALESAKNSVESSFYKPNIINKLNTVKIKPLKLNGAQSKAKKIYGKEFRSLAFYDPNKHAIFYNTRFINNISDDLSHEIFVHELIHAISDHSANTKDSSAKRLVLKSGLKKQFFSTGLINCEFRSLNEGLVQYLCNKILRKRSLTYKNEVFFVEKMIELLGEKTILRNFFGRDEKRFCEAIEKCFGLGEFLLASRRLDQKKYSQAFRIFRGHKPIVKDFYTEQRLPSFGKNQINLAIE